MRSLRAWLVAVAIVLALPASAGAHASLLSSSPANDTVLETAPDQIVLRFSEPVQAGPNAVRLFDGVARRVPVGKITQPQPTELVVALDRELERGSYTVVWRVDSADLDRINDFFVFHVAVPRPEGAGAAAGGSSGSPGAADFARYAAFALMALCAGAAAAAALGAARRRRLLGLLGGLAAALVVASVLALTLDDGSSEGAAASGGAFRTDVRMGTLDARLAVAPAQLGWNGVELELPPPTGAEGGYFEVRVRATLAAADLGPLNFRGVQSTDLAHFSVRRMYLPLPGEWTLDVSARRGIDGRYNATVKLPVGSPARD